MSTYGFNSVVTITLGLLGLMITGVVSRELITIPPPPLGTVVTINNQLGNGATLAVHCKSKDDDLGQKSLPPKGSYKFRFTPNIFTINTLFFCRMEWPWDSHYIDAYIQSRDQDRCHTDCCWNVSPTGACDCHSNYCLPWNKESLYG